MGLARKKSDSSTLEIVIAIIVVVFVFSMIGVINLQSIGGKFVVGPPKEAGTVAEVPGDQQAAATGGSESGGTEIKSVVQQTATQVSGTRLASASSDFEIMPPK